MEGIGSDLELESQASLPARSGEASGQSQIEKLRSVDSVLCANKIIVDMVTLPTSDAFELGNKPKHGEQS